MMRRVTATAALALLTGTLAACGGERPQASATAPPAFVETRALVAEDGYASVNRYSGRIEAALDSALSLEIGGYVTGMLAEEGDTVAAGDVLARLDTARLDAQRAEAGAALSQVEAELALARSTLERVEEAFGYQGVSRQELDEAAQRVSALAASRDVAAAGVRRIDIDIAKATLHAPFDGTITRRHVDPGVVLPAGSPLYRLQSLGTLDARIGITTEAAATLEPGEMHELIVNGQPVTARLRAIVGQRDERTRTVDALFRIEGAGRALRPGDTAQLETRVWQDAPGFWLPLASLSESSRGLWQALVAEPEDGDRFVLTGHVVEVLYADAERAFVRGTLQPGDLLVSSGTQRVVTGQTVRIGDSSQPISVADNGAQRDE